MAHTPGPWEVKGPAIVDGSTDYAILAEGNHIIAEAYGQTDRFTHQPSENNARLIAAAPELLAVAKEMMKYLDYTDPMEVDVGGELKEQIKAAIRKAEGEL